MRFRGKYDFSSLFLFFYSCFQPLTQPIESSFHKVRLDDYAQPVLYSPQEKPGSRQTHVLFSRCYEVQTQNYEHLERGGPLFEEDPRYPALWMKCWVDGQNVPIIRKPVSEWDWSYVKTKYPCSFFWAADIPWPRNKRVQVVLQGEFLVPSHPGKKDSFEYIDNVGVAGSGSAPYEEISFTFDLSAIAQSIPGIGKIDSSLFWWWLCDSFFLIHPRGYRIKNGKVRWSFEKVWKLDEKFRVEWYAWYRE
ncbi:hypothetical protein [Candidatus Methylacidiphilum infernorum]|uniref:Lipoprotein n=1 Tax=Methylacidiphilum infernorum (isolate V4) TaxID=481448 RepID=B3DV55_METI4|nr:hypothetical protein [Candidatus Methylacidiphilum infernorum]ACD83208.1 Hypothetical protein Minf_1153 [Methylacidiphilum infernorum V4]